MATEKKAAVPETTKILIRVAARVDAIFWPGREKFSMPREQVRFERRRDYAAIGLDLIGGGTVGERQKFGRKLQTLQAAGLLEIIEAKRRQGVRLTGRGDAIIRRMCGLYTVAESWGLLEYLVQWQSDFGEGTFPEHLAAEISQWEATDEEQTALEEMREELIPLLPLGYVWTHGDGRYPRCYWLHVTPAGREALHRGPPDDAPPEVEFSQAAFDLYAREWTRYSKQLDTAKPERPQDLYPPASCGIGWGSYAACLRIQESRR